MKFSSLFGCFSSIPGRHSNACKPGDIKVTCGRAQDESQQLHGSQDKPLCSISAIRCEQEKWPNTDFVPVATPTYQGARHWSSESALPSTYKSARTQEDAQCPIAVLQQLQRYQYLGRKQRVAGMHAYKAHCINEGDVIVEIMVYPAGSDAHRLHGKALLLKGYHHPNLPTCLSTTTAIVTEDLVRSLHLTPHHTFRGQCSFRPKATLCSSPGGNCAAPVSVSNHRSSSTVNHRTWSLQFVTRFEPQQLASACTTATSEATARLTNMVAEPTTAAPFRAANSTVDTAPVEASGNATRRCKLNPCSAPMVRSCSADAADHQRLQDACGSDSAGGIGSGSGSSEGSRGAGSGGGGGCDTGDSGDSDRGADRTSSASVTEAATSTEHLPATTASSTAAGHGSCPADAASRCRIPQMLRPEAETSSQGVAVSVGTNRALPMSRLHIGSLPQEQPGLLNTTLASHPLENAKPESVQIEGIEPRSLSARESTCGGTRQEVLSGEYASPLSENVAAEDATGDVPTNTARHLADKGLDPSPGTPNGSGSSRVLVPLPSQMSISRSSASTGTGTQHGKEPLGVAAEVFHPRPCFNATGAGTTTTPTCESGCSGGASSISLAAARPRACGTAGAGASAIIPDGVAVMPAASASGGSRGGRQAWNRFFSSTTPRFLSAPRAARSRSSCTSRGIPDLIMESSTGMVEAFGAAGPCSSPAVERFGRAAPTTAAAQAAVVSERDIHGMGDGLEGPGLADEVAAQPSPAHLRRILQDCGAAPGLQLTVVVFENRSFPTLEQLLSAPPAWRKPLRRSAGKDYMSMVEENSQATPNNDTKPCWPPSRPHSNATGHASRQYGRLLSLNDLADEWSVVVQTGDTEGGGGSGDAAAAAAAAVAEWSSEWMRNAEASGASGTGRRGWRAWSADAASKAAEPLPRGVQRTIALDVAKAMAHLHSLGLIHGDLKPANVLVKPLPPQDDDDVLEGARCKDSPSASPTASRRHFTCLVVGFSLAGQEGTGVSDASLPRTTHSVHWRALPYMAPEVVRGGRPDKPADVYSYGALLWHLTSGQPPFAQLHPAQLLVGLVSGGLSMEWPQEADPTLSDIGRACLDADPHARPSFEQILGALGQLVDGGASGVNGMSLCARAVAA